MGGWAMTNLVCESKFLVSGAGSAPGGTHIPKISWTSPWGKGHALMQEAPLQIPACLGLMEHRNIWRQELSLDLSEVLRLTETLCS